MSKRLVQVLVGTASLHVAIAAALTSVEPPAYEPPRTPVVELEQFAVPPPPPPIVPPPPVLEEEEPEPTPTTDPPPTARVDKQRTARPTIVQEETRPGPPDPGAIVVPGGDAPVLKVDNLGEGTVAVTPGKTTKQRHGGGGAGSGSGTGVGSGTGSGTAPEVVSVASIKTRAKAKRDYYDTGADYPDEARRLGVEGQIKVRLTVSAQGKVTATKLLSKLGHGLDELAISRAREFEFYPALDTDDRPVASIVVWTFTFAIPT